jgi:hypothetical protein
MKQAPSSSPSLTTRAATTCCSCWTPSPTSSARLVGGQALRGVQSCRGLCGGPPPPPAAALKPCSLRHPAPRATTPQNTQGAPDGDKEGAKKFVVLPPGVSEASLPADLKAGVTRFYSSNTNAVWVIGRVFVRDAGADAAAARALQAGMTFKQARGRGRGGGVRQGVLGARAASRALAPGPGCPPAQPPCAKPRFPCPPPPAGAAHARRQGRHDRRGVARGARCARRGGPPQGIRLGHQRRHQRDRRIRGAARGPAEALPATPPHPTPPHPTPPHPTPPHPTPPRPAPPPPPRRPPPALPRASPACSPPRPRPARSASAPPSASTPRRASTRRR